MKHKPVKRWEYFKVEGEEVKRVGRVCPRCGDNVYMAEHRQKDGIIRYTCGKCNMTEWVKQKSDEKR